MITMTSTTDGEALLSQIGFRDLRPLLRPPWHEGCGFLVRDAGGRIAVWPVPSLTPAPDRYAIGKAAWVQANRRAQHTGCAILGTIHTHPEGPEGPSERDLAIARRLPVTELRMVWYPRGGHLTLYNRTGILATTAIPAPWAWRVMAIA